MRFRIIELKNCGKIAKYQVQRKYLLWPFWMTYTYMIHPDLPDPYLEFQTKEDAEEYIQKIKAYKFKVSNRWEVQSG